jgi:hypothetical protein
MRPVRSNRVSWTSAIAAYCFVVAGALAARLVMASGFGFKFFDVWVPPNTDGFRRACGIASFTALALASIVVLFVIFRGRGVPRGIAAVCPVFAVFLYWFVLAF